MFSADERAMLVSWLVYHRDTLRLKCEGLTDEQLRIRSVPPSTLSLLGLGAAPTFGWAVAARFFGGFCNGIIGAVKTIIAEAFDEHEQPHSQSNLWLRDHPPRPA